MKLYLIPSIEKVRAYKAISNFVIYINIDKELFINEKWIAKNANTFDYVNKLDFFIYGSDKQSTIIDKNSDCLNIINGSLWINTLENNNLILANKVDGYRILSLIKITNEGKFEIIKELKNQYIIGENLRKGSFLFHRQDFEWIKCLDLSNDNHLWQFSVSELGKRKWVNGSETIEEEGQVSKMIGIMGEVLLVVITGGGDRDRARTQTIGLHTQTGELLWLLDGFEHEGITYTHLPTTATLMPDAQNEFLVGFQNRYFIEIDPQLGKVTRCRKIDDQSQIHNLATIMDSFSLQGDHLYFRSSVSSMSGFPTAVGAFNYKTETIEWLHVFEEFAKEGKFIPINQPKAEGNRVYALDSGNTLHIFERE